MTAHYIDVGQAASALLEFKSGAILIDAGGESTGDDTSRRHLVGYLNQFFDRRTDLNRTLEGIIISHPHIDHTMLLMDVMQNFKVHALVDNGADKGSGIGPLKKARQFAKQNKIQYTAVGDTSIHGGGLTMSLIEPTEPGAPKISLLSGLRGCDNANNDSIAVRIQTGEGVLVFTGDSEDKDKSCTPALSVLAQRYGQTALRGVQIYHVAHHGSFNGTTAEFMSVISPQVAIISAGDPQRSSPGQFHAFQFGHPRQVAVTTITENTTGSRIDFGGNPKDVVIFPQVKTTSTMLMNKAVYCTCWDGDIKVEFSEGQNTPRITTAR